MAVEESDKVKKMIADGQHVETHSLKDQIEWEKYQDQKEAVQTAGRKTGGIVFMKGRPSGSI